MEQDLPKRRGIRAWIVEHDDSWMFTVAYVGAAVVLSIAISLFWLAVVVAIHGLMEYVRQQHIDARQPGVHLRVAWHLKLDVALIVFAVAVGVYMEVILGAAGLGGAARLGLQSGARLGGWARAIRGVLLSVDDAAQVVRAAGSRMKGKNGEVEEEPGLHPWRKWTVGDHIAIWFGVACLLAILAAPFVLEGQTWSSMAQAILNDFHPLGTPAEE
jgi:hypothetical protein